ncbi:hypothetical protein Tco_0019334 [Tanacetum coccineum]
MAVGVPYAMSSGLSAGMAKVAAMSESAFRKRFQSSYESLPSVSPPDLPSQKHYRGTFSLYRDSEEAMIRRYEEIRRVMDFSQYDESCGIDNEGHSIKSDGLGLEEEEEAVPGGQQQAASVVGTDCEAAALGLGYRALRRRELLEEGDVYSTFKVGQGFGSTPKSERPDRVSAFRQPTLTTWTYPKDATPAAVETEGFLTELGAQVQMK